MKARIEKKLSKRLLEIAPQLFGGAWIDKKISETAYDQRTCVSHVWSVGGGVDYWGEGMEAYTVWAAWSGSGKWGWCWTDRFESYPYGHDLEGYPNIDGFKQTTPNLLRLASGLATQRSNSHEQAGGFSGARCANEVRRSKP